MVGILGVRSKFSSQQSRNTVKTRLCQGRLPSHSASLQPKTGPLGDEKLPHMSYKHVEHALKRISTKPSRIPTEEAVGTG